MAMVAASPVVPAPPLPTVFSISTRNPCSLGRIRSGHFGNGIAFRSKWQMRGHWGPVRRVHMSLAQEQTPIEVVNKEEDSEVEDEKEEKEEKEGEENMIEEAPKEQPSLVDVLLQSYREALKDNDEASLLKIQSQLNDIQAEKTALSLQAASLQDEVSAMKERFLRLNADFDNFRKRASREKSDLADSARGKVIEELLPMIDNFERAKSSIKAQTEGEQKIDNSYQAIYKQFVEIMKALGVSAVETVGKEFNPEGVPIFPKIENVGRLFGKFNQTFRREMKVHEAIMREESAEYDDGIVVQEFRRGFRLGDKLLRPAMVKVSAGPGSTKTNSASTTESSVPTAVEDEEKEKRKEEEAEAPLDEQNEETAST